MKTRIGLGAIGVAGILWGALNLLRIHEKSNPIHLLLWLAVAAGANDLILVPIVGVIGLVLARFVPGAARRYLQGALLVMGMATAIAIPMIYKQGSQPAAKSLLRQNYVGNLAIIVGITAAVAVALIAMGYLRRGRSSVKDRPASDHSSIT